MGLNRMVSLWGRTALVWFAITVSVGLYMGIRQQFQFVPAHAHLGVVGWLSSGVFAFLNAVARGDGRGRGPFLHWIAHTAGTALMTGGIFTVIATGNMKLLPFVEVGATVVVLSVFWALIMFWPRLKAETARL